MSDNNYLSGAKSGFTDNAGKSLASISRFDDDLLIVIVTKCENYYIDDPAYKDSVELYNWCFANYHLFFKNRQR